MIFRLLLINSSKKNVMLVIICSGSPVESWGLINGCKHGLYNMLMFYKNDKNEVISVLREGLHYLEETSFA